MMEVEKEKILGLEVVCLDVGWMALVGLFEDRERILLEKRFLATGWKKDVGKREDKID